MKREEKLINTVRFESYLSNIILKVIFYLTANSKTKQNIKLFLENHNEELINF